VCSQQPLAIAFDVAGLGNITSAISTVRKRLVTVGNDRVLKVWNIDHYIRQL